MTHRIIEWVNHQLSQGEPVATATVLHVSGSVPGKVGARIALTSTKIEGTVGGAGLEYKVIKRLKQMLSSGIGGEVITYGLNKGAKGHEVVALDSLCGGRATLSLEVIMPMPHILLLGGGHVGQAIAVQCDALGWDYSVQDTRAEFVSKDIFPSAKGLDYCSVSEFFSSLNLKKYSDVLLLGHDWKEDEERLIGLLKMDDSPIDSRISSRARCASFFSNLATSGYHCPAMILKEDTSNIR
jgi:xanthine dehydrogenase accessory factor